MGPTQSLMKLEPILINMNGFHVHFAQNNLKIGPTRSGKGLEPELMKENILHYGFDLRKWPHS